MHKIRNNWRGKICIIPGCTNNARCKGMCVKCYNIEKQREKEQISIFVNDSIKEIVA